MQSYLIIFYAYLAIINLIAVLLMISDKSKAINNQERIPEAYFFFCSILFGSAGTMLGMLLFRHKVRKWYFTIGVPLILLQNIFTFLFLYSIVFENTLKY